MTKSVTSDAMRLLKIESKLGIPHWLGVERFLAWLMDRPKKDFVVQCIAFKVPATVRYVNHLPRNSMSVKIT